MPGGRHAGAYHVWVGRRRRRRCTGLAVRGCPRRRVRLRPPHPTHGLRGRHQQHLDGGRNRRFGRSLGGGRPGNRSRRAPRGDALHWREADPGEACTRAGPTPSWSMAVPCFSMKTWCPSFSRSGQAASTLNRRIPCRDGSSDCFLSFWLCRLAARMKLPLRTSLARSGQGV